MLKSRVRRLFLLAGLAAMLAHSAVTQSETPPDAEIVTKDYVLVNGGVVIDQGKHTGIKTGHVLYGPGRVK